MKKRTKNHFLSKDLSYFTGTKKFITIEDSTAESYKVILALGSGLFAIGLWLFLVGAADFGIFFLFIGTVFFLARGLYHYLNYLRHKDIPLTLHHQNLKVGKTLRGYATISVPCECKDFKIILENRYSYAKQVMRNNKTTTERYSNLIWSYETKGYVKTEGDLTRVYFKIPISKDASATKALKDSDGVFNRKITWTLTISSDEGIFPLTRTYELNIRK